MAFTAVDAAAGFVDSASAAGGHAFRSAARVKALELLAATRFDAAGLDEADVEAGSRQIWKRFVAALPLHDHVFLRIYRCGAIRTPTRRHRTGDQACYPFCAFPNASATHF